MSTERNLPAIIAAPFWALARFRPAPPPEAPEPFASIFASASVVRGMCALAGLAVAWLCLGMVIGSYGIRADMEALAHQHDAMLEEIEADVHLMRLQTERIDAQVRALWESSRPTDSRARTR